MVVGNSSLFVFQLAVRRCLHIGSRPAAATVPGVHRNLIVPGFPQASSDALSLNLQYRSYSTSPVVQSAGRHWYTERLAAVGLLALIPTGFVYPNPVVDYGLAVLVPFHGHWGLMAVVEDYSPQMLKGAGKGLVYMLSIGTFLGLMYLNVKDVGICGAAKAIWSL